MKSSNNELAAILDKRFRLMPEYSAALEVVRLNSEGHVWLIGGIVSRILLDELYGIPQKEFDFDFLVENVAQELIVPRDWSVKHEKHGNPTFYKNALEVDLFPIATHNYIQAHSLKPTLQNFFKGVPFTIQAMAFDVKTQRLKGRVGIAALKAREYRVNNLLEAQGLAQRKGVRLNEYIKRKGESLGLVPVLVTE